MTEFTFRVAEKRRDRVALEQFTCTEPDGPAHEKVVQTYFRSQALSHAGHPDSVRHDHRLLLVHTDDTLVGAACHRRSTSPLTRNVVFAAVAFDARGRTVGDVRVSDALWDAVVTDATTRSGEPPRYFQARVHPDNTRCLAYCERLGLLPYREQDGLILVAGALP